MGINADSVNKWLAANGYATKMSDADLAAHREKMLPYWTASAAGATTRPAGEQLAAHLAAVKKAYPDFDAYPVYIQDSLLDSDFRGEFGSADASATEQAIRENDWSQAASDYQNRPEFSEAESYFAAKDAYDALSDKTTPEAKALADTMAKYQNRAGDRDALTHMQNNQLAYMRFARELDVERTWNRAVISGNEGFAFIPPANQSANADNRAVKTVDVVDMDNRQRFAISTPPPTAPPFEFTVGSSTFGFTDITVNASTPFVFKLLDRHIVDGDIETVSLVNGRGSQINQTITLTSAGQQFTTRVQRGANELRVFAVNQGTLGVNSGGLRINSPVLTGPIDQDVSLNTGQTGILRITGR
jgi:hypothetical protein